MILTALTAALCLFVFIACFCFGIYAVRDDSAYCMLGMFFALLAVVAGRNTARKTR